MALQNVKRLAELLASPYNSSIWINLFQVNDKNNFILFFKNPKA